MNGSDAGSRKGAKAQREFFPVLDSLSSETVPWLFMEQFRAAARKNHYQSLEYLASRGGLSWAEIYMVAIDKRWTAGIRVNSELAKVIVLDMLRTFAPSREPNSGGQS